MYIYGDAVIGDKEATEIATAENHSNKAVGEGGGIYVAESGKLYMGYSDYTSETENTPAEWKKGIYYNYSESGGGGLGFAYSSSAVIRMNSGTIANNGATKKGGAAYITCNAFTISGTATIPATKIPKPENPTEDDGTQDLTLMKELITNLPDVPVFVRTTILPGTSEMLTKETGHQVCYMPEFLTERTFIEDFRKQTMVFTGAQELRLKKDCAPRGTQEPREPQAIQKGLDDRNRRPRRIRQMARIL